MRKKRISISPRWRELLLRWMLQAFVLGVCFLSYGTPVLANAQIQAKFNN